MSKVISIKYDNKPCYNIYLEHDFTKLPEKLMNLGYTNQRKICIVTDSNVSSFYLEKLRNLLRDIFSNCTSFIFTAGEEYKNLDTVGKLYEHLIQNSFERKDLLIALGGGVVGDLTGFTAATYLRGIDFIQVPTTLLSQVDSSIGGKTGIDFMQYKNMVGAFYMPKLVYINLSTLHTLPKRQFASGMAEILKHGQIKDISYYKQVINNYDKIMSYDMNAIQDMIYGSCMIKGDVVQRDPKEQGERAFLNFGHTIGHAIEKLSNFTLYHGECVALGMVAAAYISYKHGSLSKESLLQLEDSIELYQLPIRTSFTQISPEEILKATKSDKKMDAGKVKFVLLREAGQAYITKELTDEQILDGIRYLYIS